MSLNLDKLSVEELVALEKNTKSLIKQKQRDELKKAFVQFQEIAKSLGASVEDVIKAGKTVKNKRPIKYQNPNNPAQGWSGQGRKPGWLEAELAAGKQLDDFLIN